ncbi:hypothetical protein [Gimesia panareensis]|uniref:Formyltransferase/hydrolase complex Fhc subunit B n=1 Tax=Gimesia panareensis TaxID=2527978 RepID=A0A517Q5D6_9PLAN|nr:hypothetical protein [Gimesia panareensis]QDT26841.1 Formyltransferase/hydrolase complex Fhc subunit B [Gimesia panareensis]QDU50322.1 Formyltransferase/hydrolase complex Fhc subunit B [Gimesia panareensis]
MKNVIEDVTCAGCCCVCDHIQVTTDGQQIIDVQTTCPQGQAWFAQSRQTEKQQPLIKGIDASREAAIARAAGLIQEAQSPLLCGMGQSAVDAQRAAISLADLTGATIDSGASAATRALQQVGEANCTLGEVRSRADLIIYWNAENLRFNAHHQQSLVPPGEPVPRKIVTVGSELPGDSRGVDLSLTVSVEDEFEILWRLRALLKGVALEGTTAGELASLAALMQQSSYIVIFFGPASPDERLFHRKLEALSLLAREIQAERRCHTINVPAAGATKGAEPVLAWQTGYAAAVNFAAGYPRFSPCEYSTVKMLEQGEADLCLLIGEDPLTGLSDQAIQRLQQIPLIHVGPVPLVDLQPEVYIPTGISGIHAAGSLYRFDGTPLPLRALISTQQASEAEILNQIETLLKPVMHIC